jgi:hypothetical protein
MRFFVLDSAKYNKALAKTLDSISDLDQTVRNQYLKALNENKDKALTDSLLALMRSTDQSNQEKVDAILSRYGWLSPQTVGFKGSNALFLVIQHADLPMQKKYLPVLTAAEARGELLSSSLAFLVDRINMKEGKKQIYGSQGISDGKSSKRYIYPIEDPDELDARRRSVGLSPMSEYVPGWDLEAYKKELPEIEKIAAKIVFN